LKYDQRVEGTNQEQSTSLMVTSEDENQTPWNYTYSMARVMGLKSFGGITSNRCPLYQEWIRLCTSSVRHSGIGFWIKGALFR